MTFTRKFLLKAMGIAAVLCGCYSCITNSAEVGADLLALDQQYDTYHASFPIENIELRMTDSLSGYSQKRITIGSIRDSEFGLTRRGSAITVIPCYDSLDFGTNPQFESFRIVLLRDTMSVNSDQERTILQNVYAYELEEKISKLYDINALERGTLKHGSERITKYTPVFDGAVDTLGIDFSEKFGQSYMERLIDLKLDGTKSLDDILNVLPGIYLETSDPIGEGGRINMFDLQLGFDASTYQLKGNYGEMKFRSTYDGEEKDTSFLFWFSPDSLYNFDSLMYYGTSGSLPEYCLNVTSQETRHMEGMATDMLYVEGGGGIKPVISASEIRDLILEEIAKNGGDGASTVINKARLVLPFKFPDDWKDMDIYPQRLSPTSRIGYNTEDSEEGHYAFANLTDASATDENQGDVDRSNLVYSPDITYHAQSIIRLKDDAKISDYDVWFLIVYNEIDDADETSAYESEMNDYYNSMMYASYYNSMYGGYGGYGGYGYGGYGYGGYGGYGSGYSNYYSMMLMSQYYSSMYNTSSVSYTPTLDKDRYYHAKLYGPQYPDPDLRPRMEITYSVPKVSD